MRLVSFLREEKKRIGCVIDDKVLDLSIAAPTLPDNLVDFLEVGADAMSAASEAIRTAKEQDLIPLDGLSYLPLIPSPPKIICIGRNYAAHAIEGGAQPPTYPEIFFRCSTSLLAHNAPIIRPKCSDKLDFEAELVAIVGKRARHVSKADALSVIAGYSIFNDATLRDYQRKSSQWTIGKNFDSTGPFGPEFVTADELPPGAHGLQIQTRLNGETMQNANTADFIFPMDELIVYLSECMTLEPGDVIVTGTPSGVGYARTPPVFMKDGDMCEVEIEGIGILRNSIENEA